MQNTVKTPQQPITVLGRIGANPSRLMTVRDWWHEMDEPVDMLLDPDATFYDDERKLIEQCAEDGIAYRAASKGEGPTAFPVWRLAVFYPLNL